MSESDDSDFEYGNLSESGSDESDESDTECDESSDDDTSVALARTWYALNIDHPPPAPPKFPFMGAAGCTFTLPNREDILAYYQLFIDDDFINLLVSESNKCPTTTRVTSKVMVTNNSNRNAKFSCD